LRSGEPAGYDSRMRQLLRSSAPASAERQEKRIPGNGGAAQRSGDTRTGRESGYSRDSQLDMLKNPAKRCWVPLDALPELSATSARKYAASLPTSLRHYPAER
jgi:hypothetical protein